MTFGCASSGSDDPSGRKQESANEAWVVGPDGAFPIDLRTGARSSGAPRTPAGEMRCVLIPGLDVTFVSDPLRHVFVPLEPPTQDPEDPAAS